MARIISFEDMVKEAEAAQKQRLEAASILSTDELKEFWSDEEDWEGLKKSLTEERRKLQRFDSPSTDEDSLREEDEGVLYPVDPWASAPFNEDEEVLPFPFALTPREILPYENGIHNYWMANGCMGVRVKQVIPKMHGKLYVMIGECPIHGRDHHSNHWFMFEQSNSTQNDWISCHHGNVVINKRYLDVKVFEMDGF